jgi:excisionase family DNA binding protein
LAHIIACIDFNRGSPALVLAHEEIPRAPLPRPGQRGDVYTFRILDPPKGLPPKEAAALVEASVRALGGRPGVDWPVAYNVPWVKLRDGDVSSEEGAVPVEEAASILGLTRETVYADLAQGRLASTRPPQMKSGHRPHLINLKDLRHYQAHKPPRGRPKKEP